MFLLFGFGESELMMVSHSSVTTKVTTMLGLLEMRTLHRFIIGLMWPRPGYGTATMWVVVVVVGGGGFGGSMEEMVMLMLSILESER